MGTDKTFGDFWIRQNFSWRTRYIDRNVGLKLPSKIQVPLQESEQTYLYPSVPEEQLYIITNGCWQAWHTHFVDINNQRQGQKLLIIKRPKTSRPLCNPWRDFFGRFYSRFCLFFNNRVACWLCHFFMFWKTFSGGLFVIIQLLT